MESSRLTAATLTLLGLAASWQPSLASPPRPQTAHTRTPQAKSKKPKASARRKRVVKPLLPSKPPGDVPEVKEAASVWRGCLESRGLSRLALNLGVEQSRLEPLISDLGLQEQGTQCAPYVAATGGEAGAASVILQRPNPKPGEPMVLDIRKTADGIMATPGACDCPEPVRRVLDFPAQDSTQHHDEILASVPANVRWQLETLMPQMIGRLSQKKLLPEEVQPHADDEPFIDSSSVPDARTNAYTVRIALDRRRENEPEHLQSLEILDSANGKTVDGAWWLDRPGGPGVFIGMEGVAYERLLWQSPIKYVMKTRGIGPASTTYRRRVSAPKGSTGKPRIRTVTVREFHLGADLMAPKGTEVHAVGDAKVAFAGRMGGFGKLIILDHGLGYQTYYAHLSVIESTTKVGANIARGDVIGLVGSTGHSTAPHLHFETRKDTKYLDPFDSTRQWDYWLLTPDDQERLAMELLAPPPAIVPEGSGIDGPEHKLSKVNH